MRVLWFSRTPSGATEKMTGKLGIGNGWVESLEGHLKKHSNIQLGVVFPWRTDKRMSFELEGTNYYAVPVKKDGKIKSIISNHLGKFSRDASVDHYLEVINEFKPDVIVVFGTEKNFGLITSKVNIPVLIWIQGIFSVYTQMFFKGFSKKEVWKHSKKKPMLYGYSHIHKYHNARRIAGREKEMLRHSRYVIGRTRWDRRVLSILAPKATYFHCDDMLRDDFYKTEWLPHSKRGKLVLVTTIQDNLYKGLEMIFGSAKLLHSILKGKMEWRIAGISKKVDLLKIAQGKFKCLPEEIGVTPLGRIPAPDLINELLNADIYVHASHIENSPNAVCEAMLLGMPVVSTICGGVTDLIQDNRDGVLVQSGDVHSMTGAILDLHRDTAKAVEFGRSAKKQALKKHDPQKITQTFIDILYEAAGKVNEVTAAEKKILAS